MDTALGHLLLDTFDAAIQSSWRGFAFAVAALLEARVTQGAEQLLTPLLRAASRLLGNSWRPWVVIAAIGLALRARADLLRRPIYHTQYRRPELHPRNDEHVPNDGRDASTAVVPFRRHDGGMSVPLPDGSGTWHFVPSSDTEPLRHMPASAPPPSPISRVGPSAPLLLTSNVVPAGRLPSDAHIRLRGRL